MIQETKILVVGDCMLDIYQNYNVVKLSPEAPVPVVNDQSEFVKLGGAANVAANVRALGVDTSVLYICGTDKISGDLSQKLSEANVSAHHVTDELNPTITKTRITVDNRQFLRYDREGFFSSKAAYLLRNEFLKVAQNFNVIIFSDYGKGSLQNISEMIGHCNKLKIPTIVDPKGDNFKKYRGAYLLTPNKSEFKNAFGKFKSKLSASDLHEAKKNWRVSNLIVTLGSEGMCLCDEKGYFLTLPAAAKEVFDVTGAGDSVVAALAVCISRGEALPAAMSFANRVAGLAVGQVGNAVINASDVNEEALTVGSIESKLILSEPHLSILWKKLKDNGNKIVMTNGCFDLIHRGHVNCLSEAKNLGDILIVAINSDSSVKKLKGINRPINKLEDRMFVVAGLESVDYVIAFESETPESLYSEFTPDVLVKGGDYRMTNISGYNSVVHAGGKVIVLDYLNGFSTSNILKKNGLSSQEN